MIPSLGGGEMWEKRSCLSFTSSITVPSIKRVQKPPVFITLQNTQERSEIYLYHKEKGDPIFHMYTNPSDVFRTAQTCGLLGDISVKSNLKISSNFGSKVIFEYLLQRL